MKQIKCKVISLILAAICSLTVCLTGCYKPSESDGTRTDFTDGDLFGEIFVNNNRYGTGVIVLGLSTEGYYKKEVVVPRTILGYPFIQFNRWYSGIDPEWESYHLEKVFIEPPYKAVTGNMQKIFTTKLCPNLKKVVLISGGINVDFEICYLRERDFFERYIKFYQRDSFFYSEDDGHRPANISYYYNYEESPNDGYYWIDDIDYGELITFIPPIPTREGYEFDGWYKETECFNLWDYENDTIPEEITNQQGQVKYQETILYAKWVAKLS